MIRKARNESYLDSITKRNATNRRTQSVIKPNYSAPSVFSKRIFYAVEAEDFQTVKEILSTSSLTRDDLERRHGVRFIVVHMGSYFFGGEYGV